MRRRSAIGSRESTRRSWHVTPVFARRHSAGRSASIAAARASACAHSTPKLYPFSADAPSSRSTGRATTASWWWPSAFCSCFRPFGREPVTSVA